MIFTFVEQVANMNILPLEWERSGCSRGRKQAFWGNGLQVSDLTYVDASLRHIVLGL